MGSYFAEIDTCKRRGEPAHHDHRRLRTGMNEKTTG
jgi:hypothetical protein